MKRHQPDGSDSSLSLRLFKVTTIDQTLLNLLLTVNAKHDITSLIGVRFFFIHCGAFCGKPNIHVLCFSSCSHRHTHTRACAQTRAFLKYEWNIQNVYSIAPIEHKEPFVPSLIVLNTSACTCLSITLCTH